jgi:putative DNA primase/helicase
MSDSFSVTQSNTKSNLSNKPQGSDILNYALRYACQYGWPVFPLHSIRDGKCSCDKPDCVNQGKHPCTQHGFKDATTNEKKIREWRWRWPQANIGRPTGRTNGVVVLDIDPRHGGLENLAELEATHGPLDTLSLITGSGGVHYHFLAPEISLKSLDGAIASGIDTKAEGGYVILPPSNHLSGDLYRWGNKRTPAHIPDWLLNLWPKQQQSPSRSGAPAIYGDIIDGNRDKTLTSWAGSMRQRGMSEGAILAALRYENEMRCKPPLPDDIVQQKARGMSRYKLGSPAPYTKPKNFKTGKHPKIYLPTVEVSL